MKLHMVRGRSRAAGARRDDGIDGLNPNLGVGRIYAET